MGQHAAPRTARYATPWRGAQQPAERRNSPPRTGLPDDLKRSICPYHGRGTCSWEAGADVSGRPSKLVGHPPGQSTLALNVQVRSPFCELLGILVACVGCRLWVVLASLRGQELELVHMTAQPTTRIVRSLG